MANDILITQSGVGTDKIGRFDIVVDDDTNSIVEWEWQLLSVDEKLADPELQKFIDSFQEKVDRKYKTRIKRFARQLTHPRRNEETLRPHGPTVRQQPLHRYLGWHLLVALGTFVNRPSRSNLWTGWHRQHHVTAIQAEKKEERTGAMTDE